METQVFVMGYTSTDNANSAANTIQSNGNYGGSVQNNYLPEQGYREFVVKVSDVNPCGSNECFLWDNSTFTAVGGNPCFVSSDMEIDSLINTTGIGLAVWNPVCGASGGNGTGPATPTGGPINTNLTTWGGLVTMDGGQYVTTCDYQASGNVSGLPGAAWLSCTGPYSMICHQTVRYLTLCCIFIGLPEIRANILHLG